MINTKLFIRQHTAVSLTDAARDLLESVRPLIVEVGLATARASDRGRDMTLYIGCMASFANYYLLPRLHSFQSENPDIELRLGTVVSIDGLDRRDYDVAIRYGYGDWPGFINERVYDEEIFPVCSPDLIKRGPRLRSPAD